MNCEFLSTNNGVNIVENKENENEEKYSKLFFKIKFIIIIKKYQKIKYI